jgi:hypothetical protein
MYRVTTDKAQKLVEVEISGFVQADEATRISTEVKRTLPQFGPKEAILLFDLTGFAPMTKDVTPILRGMGRDVIGFFRKAALVQEFGSHLPGQRPIEPAPGGKLRSFPTREAALQYLQQPEE